MMILQNFLTGFIFKVDDSTGVRASVSVTDLFSLMSGVCSRKTYYLPAFDPLVIGHGQYFIYYNFHLIFADLCF